MERNADIERRPLIAGCPDGVEQVVVIPAMAENSYLFDTLESLATNRGGIVARTLAVCVVNNRRPGVAAGAVLAENAATLERLEQIVREDAYAPLRVGYIDASSPGCELPESDGVGLARKIGMDRALRVLCECDSSCPVLLSLDADTRVAPNYLEAVHEHFAEERTGGAVVAYAHRFDGSPREVAGVIVYELFLRYHSLGLAYAGSPYALYGIGSTITCTGGAYAAVSGMNRRQAGEDFYFLEKLVKTGRVEPLRSTVVLPSSRASSRVPFGTGPRVRDFDATNPECYAVYNVESYAILRRWLLTATTSLDESAETLMKRAGQIALPLSSYLDSICFSENWDTLKRNAPDPERFAAQFHRWFDGLKTLRLIHHLRDNGYPDQDMFVALPALLDAADVSVPRYFDHDPKAYPGLQKAVLAHMRHVTAACTAPRPIST